MTIKPKPDGDPMPYVPDTPGPIIYCLHCGTALVNGACPNGHSQTPAPTGDDGRQVIHVEPGLDWSPLSDFEIGEIHAGLAIPSQQMSRRMALEIRKWRGTPNPELI